MQISVDYETLQPNERKMYFKSELDYKKLNGLARIFGGNGSHDRILDDMSQLDKPII